MMKQRWLFKKTHFVYTMVYTTCQTSLTSCITALHVLTYLMEVIFLGIYIYTYMTHNNEQEHTTTNKNTDNNKEDKNKRTIDTMATCVVIAHCMLVDNRWLWYCSYCLLLIVVQPLQSLQKTDAIAAMKRPKDLLFFNRITWSNLRAAAIEKDQLGFVLVHLWLWEWQGQLKLVSCVCVSLHCLYATCGVGRWVISLTSVCAFVLAAWLWNWG